MSVKEIAVIDLNRLMANLPLESNANDILKEHLGKLEWPSTGISYDDLCNTLDNVPNRRIDLLTHSSGGSFLLIGSGEALTNAKWVNENAHQTLLNMVFHPAAPPYTAGFMIAFTSLNHFDGILKEE